jgi:hypothetical protein
MSTLFCIVTTILIHVYSHDSLALKLAQDINSAHRVNWSKMTDDEGNVRYIINLEKMPTKNSLGLEQTLLKHHHRCESSLREEKR